MLKINPDVSIKSIEKYGFRHCAGYPKELNCYYLCTFENSRMLFASPEAFEVFNWNRNDQRIHKYPKVAMRGYLDIIYDMIQDGVLIKEEKRWRNQN